MSETDPMWYDNNAALILADIRFKFYEMRQQAGASITPEIGEHINRLSELLRDSFTADKAADLHAVARIVDILMELCDDKKREFRKWWFWARERIVWLNNNLPKRLQSVGSNSSLLL